MFGIDKEIYNIFKGASNTFFYYSLFFPKAKRQDIFDFYAFVRIADEFVDKPDQDIEGLNNFKSQYIKGQTSNKFIANFLELEAKYSFDKAWTKSFFHSIELDTHRKIYQTQQELNEYLYGIAEVIGLFMSSILELDSRAYQFAQLHGRAMQYANIIRDIYIDQKELGRTYIPLEHIKNFGLKSLELGEVNNNPGNFKQLIEFEAKEFERLLILGEEGFKYINKRALIPIKAAADAYKLVIKRIVNNPMLIFETKVKPKKYEFYIILFKALFYQTK